MRGTEIGFPEACVQKANLRARLRQKTLVGKSGPAMEGEIRSDPSRQFVSTMGMPVRTIQ